MARTPFCEPQTTQTVDFAAGGALYKTPVADVIAAVLCEPRRADACEASFREPESVDFRGMV